MLSWTKYSHLFTHDNLLGGEEKSDGVERSVTIIPHPGGQESRCLSIFFLEKRVLRHWTTLNPIWSSNQLSGDAAWRTTHFQSFTQTLLSRRAIETCWYTRGQGSTHLLPINLWSILMKLHTQHWFRGSKTKCRCSASPFKVTKRLFDKWSHERWSSSLQWLNLVWQKMLLLVALFEFQWNSLSNIQYRVFEWKLICQKILVCLHLKGNA